MQTKFRFIFFGLVTSLLVTQCQIKPNTGKPDQKVTSQQQKTIAVTTFDTINEQLHNYSEMMTSDLIAMKVIDTTLTNILSETCYCDTTVQLNDSVYYSIISVNDEAGVCTHFYITSINNKSKEVVSSKYLQADCDVDYSWNTYELFDHKVISKDKIQLIKTTVSQKKKRTSPDEEANIYHKQIQKSYLIISGTGQLNNRN